MSKLTTKAYQLPSAGEYGTLYRIAAFCAIAVACLIPIQAAIFILFPPPQTVAEYFTLFQSNRFLGLLDLDLLLTLDNIVMIPFYFALYFSLKKYNASLSMLGLAFGLVSVTLYIISREATFSMMALSDQFAAAQSEVLKSALLASGQTFLTMFNGSTFDVSYVMGAAALSMLSIVIVKNRVFSKATAIVAVFAAVLMFIPPTIGPVGIVISLLSLIPTLLWLALMAKHFLKMTAKK